MNTPDWIEEGRCHDRPHLTYLFFSDDPSEQKTAKAMCGECPVRAHCLVYSLESNERFGIWGGTSPAERKRIRERIIK